MSKLPGPPPGNGLGGGAHWAGKRGSHLHTDVAQGAVVGPGWAVEAALLAPLQAEGPVVHPYHVHRHGTLFIGAWHGKRIGQHQEPLLSVSLLLVVGSPAVLLSSKKDGE